MSWKLSVVEWASNFSRGNYVRTSLVDPVSAGATAIDVVDDDLVDRTFLPGDIIKLGLSSSAGNGGKFEYARLAAAPSGGHILLSSALAYSYASGDHVDGTGHGTPQGWDFYDSGDASNIFTPIGINTKFGSSTTGAPFDGYKTTTGFWGALACPSGSDAAILYHDTQRKLLYQAVYRLGLYAALPSGTSFYANVYDSSFSHGSWPIIMSSTSTWTKFEAVGRVYQAPSANARVALFDLESSITFGVDCIYLTHASSLDATAEAAGAYTLPCNPVQVSGDDDEYDTVDRGYHNQMIISGSLDVLRPRGFNLVFDAGDAQMLRNLAQLDWWQRQGSMLMLETDDLDMRPCFGYMTFVPSFVHWDTSRISISINFKGVQ
jgi:hypothetical protein